MRAAIVTAVVLAAMLACSATVASGAQLAPPQLPVHAAALIESGTGLQLYGDAAQRELPIASTTKLMTALLTLERTRLDTVFTEPDYHPAAVDSQIGLVPGERMSVHDLLLALLLPSADDAAEDLAENVGGGSVARFVAMMNVRARQLGLSHTHYSTPIGLDTPGNYSSAADLVALARYLRSAQPFFRRAVALPRATLHSGSHVRVVTNRNDLVGQVPWVDGIKTGHTSQAGYVLVGSGTRDGMTLISAVLGTIDASQRDATTMDLLRYGFANFGRRTPVRAGTALASPSVRYRSGRHAELVATRSFTVVLPRDAAVQTRVQAPRQLSGPLPRGAHAGRIDVLVDGRRTASVPLVLARALPGVGVLTVAAAFLTRGTTLVFIVVVLIALGLVAGLGRGWTRRRAAEVHRR